MFLTLTCPSYGRVREDGTPADPDSYDYQRAARDALRFAALFDRFIQNLRRFLGYDVLQWQLGRIEATGGSALDGDLARQHNLRPAHQYRARPAPRGRDQQASRCGAPPIYEPTGHVAGAQAEASFMTVTAQICDHALDLGFHTRAGDENRTRTISLGIRPIHPAGAADQPGPCTASTRG